METDLTLEELDWQPCSKVPVVFFLMKVISKSYYFIFCVIICCVIKENVPGTPVFTHFTSARQRYALVTQIDKNENWIERVTEMDIKKKKKKRQYKYLNLKKHLFAGQNIHQVASLLIAIKLMQLCHNVYANFRLEYQRQFYYRTAFLFQDQY